MFIFYKTILESNIKFLQYNICKSDCNNIILYVLPSNGGELPSIAIEYVDEHFSIIYKLDNDILIYEFVEFIIFIFDDNIIISLKFVVVINVFGDNNNKPLFDVSHNKFVSICNLFINNAFNIIDDDEYNKILFPDIK